VTAIVPARDEEDHLSQTLGSLHDLDLSHVIVVDDGSRDATAALARRSGAEVVPATLTREPGGKGRALLTGLRHARLRAPDAVLLLDADLGTSATHLGGLIEALGQQHPATIAAFPPAKGPVRGGFGLVKIYARRTIAARNPLGYVPEEPLSGQRALLVPALEALPGVAPGFGAEVGMTLDLLSAGIIPLDVRLPLSHRPTGRTLPGFAHRARQGLDVVRAVHGARLKW